MTTRKKELKLTDISSEPLYLFTWAPKNNTYSILFSWNYYCNEYFRKWNKFMHKFEINPELNANNNIHFHGFFQIKCKALWQQHLTDLKYRGHVKISKIRHDFNQAMVYPRKDREIMEFHIHRDSIPHYSIPYTQSSRTKSKIELTYLNDKDEEQLKDLNIDAWLQKQFPII